MVDSTNLKPTENDDNKIINYYIEEDFQYFGHLENNVTLNFKWMRIIDIIDDPCLMEVHDSYHDGYVICGSQSARWFPILYTILRSSQDYMRSVVKDVKLQDNYNKVTYDGSFQFSFYGHNQWTNLKIDDILPFAPEGQKSLISISSNKEEILPSLVEKAYAKFLGGYGKFQSTNFIEAVMHFTGGIIEEVPLRRGLDPMPFQEQKSFFKRMKSISPDMFILCQTSSNKDTPDVVDSTVENLLPANHYYLITGFTSIPLKSRSNVVLSVLSSLVDSNNLDTVDLVRLHNPVITGDWGGAYNIGSPEWEGMSENVRQHYNLKFEHEFEFWISINDFCKNMSAVLFCHIPNNRLLASLLKSVGMWYSFDDYGQYGLHSPGDSIENLGNQFLKNDQYLIDVTTVKEVNIKAVLHVESTDVFVSFNEGCGIIILKVENNRIYKLHEVKNSINVSYNTLSFTERTFTISLVLSRGRYIVLPWRQGNSDIGYFFKIYYTNSSVNIKTLKEDSPPFVDCFTCGLMKTVSRAKDSIMTNFMKDNSQNGRKRKDQKCLSCTSVNPADAIRMTVISGENLEIKSNKSRNNSYFVLTCGSYSYKSMVKNLTTQPLWNDDFIFFRVDPLKDLISIEVFYEESFGFDKSLGVHTFNQYEISRADGNEITASLNIVNNKELVPTSSKIKVKFQSYLPSDFYTI